MPNLPDSQEVYVDVCGLQPPEPMERVLEALADLKPGQHVRMLIDREPKPLYRILERNNYRFDATLREDALYEIVIRQR